MYKLNVNGFDSLPITIVSRLDALSASHLAIAILAYFLIVQPTPKRPMAARAFLFLGDGFVFGARAPQVIIHPWKLPQPSKTNFQRKVLLTKAQAKFPNG